MLLVKDLQTEERLYSTMEIVKLPVWVTRGKSFLESVSAFWERTMAV
jgi:hypothetical protein